MLFIKAKSLFLVLLVMSTFSLVAQQNRIKNFSSEDGLPSDMVYGVLIDHAGFLWLGTDSGLSRFDGYSFTNYTMGDGLPDNEILNLFEDSEKRIWLRTINGKVGYIYRGEIYTSKNGGIPESLNFNSKISGIEEDSTGDIWVSSDYGGVKKYTSEGKVIQVCSGEVKPTFMTKNPAGTGVLTFSDRIVKINEDHSIQELKVVLEGNSLGRNGIHKGKVYFVNSKVSTPLYVFDPTLQKLDTVLYPDARVHNIRSINDNLTLLTLDGVFVYNDTFQQIDHLLKGKAVADILVDNEKNYWVSSLNEGLFCISTSEVSVPHYSNKNDSEIRTMQISNSGEVWFGNNQGIFTIDSSLKTTIKYQGDFNSVNQICFDGFGNDWIASDHGLFVNGKKVDILYEENARYRQQSGRTVCCLGQNIIFGTPNLILEWKLPADHRKLFSGEHFPNVKYAEALSGINVVSPGTGDSLFIGSENGLFLSHNHLITNVSEKYGPFTGRIHDINESPFGILVAAATGLFCLNNDTIQKYGKPDGLIDEFCRSLLVLDSVLWVGTNKGIQKLKITAKGFKTSGVLTRNEGLPSNQINDIVKRKNQILVATPKGVAAFDSQHKFQKKWRIPIFLKAVFVDEQEIKLSHRGNYEIGPEVNNLRIQYFGISYRSMDDMRYQYRFVNGTEEPPWQSTKNREVSTWNPKSGLLLFQVRAQNTNGTYTDTLSVDFDIKPYYWERWWFSILVFLIFTLLGCLFMVVVQHIKRNRRMVKDQLISSELKALRSQINPHFMFNALNSIYHFVLHNNRQKAEEYLTKFSKLMRLTLRYSEKTMTSVEKEYELLSLYLEMELLRVSNKFHFSIRIDPKIDESAEIIPSMIVQPFVENTIWHGLLQKEGDRRLDIDFVMKSEHLLIRVEDNGVGFRESDLSKGSMGIQLIYDRLRLMENYYHAKIGYELLSLDDGINGTCVKIKIPIP